MSSIFVKEEGDYYCVVLRPRQDAIGRTQLEKLPEAYVESTIEGKIKQVCYPKDKFSKEDVETKVSEVIAKDLEGCPRCEELVKRLKEKKEEDDFSDLGLTGKIAQWLVNRFYGR